MWRDRYMADVTKPTVAYSKFANTPDNNAEHSRTGCTAALWVQ
jgi:hypothetical protein